MVSTTCAWSTAGRAPWGCGWALRRALVALGLPALVITVLVMCAVSATVLLLNIKSLTASLRALNSMK